MTGEASESDIGFSICPILYCTACRVQLGGYMGTKCGAESAFSATMAAGPPRNLNEPCARCSPETYSVPLGALAAAAARNGPRTAGLAGTRTTLPSQTW